MILSLNSKLLISSVINGANGWNTCKISLSNGLKFDVFPDFFLHSSM